MTTETGIHDCLQRMYNLRRFGIILGLDTIGGILARLGNPQNNFRSIHIAGTNGKGSVAAGLAAVLHGAGYKVGLYTSPHLVRFNERICINGQPISDERVIAAYQRVDAVRRGDREPTFFEFSTAMALDEFSRQEVDWAVVETGMGGRLDATNIITPSLCIVTNISLEHREYLGDTIAAITREKAGILKPGVPAVTGVTQRTAVSAMTAAADAAHAARVFQRGRDFSIRRRPGGDGFTYYGIDGTVMKGMQTALQGRHQHDNAALVIAACEVLNGTYNTALTMDHIRKGLLASRWPGRLETLAHAPTVLLDGAHNLTAVQALAHHLRTHYKDKTITLVLGILGDKAYARMLGCLLPLCRRAIFTQPKIDRALAADTLKAAAKRIVPEVKVIADVAEAVAHAVATSRPEEMVCITGSLYLVGEVKEAVAAGTLSLPQIEA